MKKKKKFWDTGSPFTSFVLLFRLNHGHRQLLRHRGCGISMQMELLRGQRLFNGHPGSSIKSHHFQPAHLKRGKGWDPDTDRVPVLEDKQD